MVEIFFSILFLLIPGLLTILYLERDTIKKADKKEFFLKVALLIKDYQLLIGLIVASIILAWGLGAFEAAPPKKFIPL